MFAQELVRAGGKKYKRPGPTYSWWGGDGGILRYDKDRVWRLYNPSNPNMYYTLVHLSTRILERLNKLRNRSTVIQGWITPSEFSYPIYNVIPVVVRKW